MWCMNKSILAITEDTKLIQSAKNSIYLFVKIKAFVLNAESIIGWLCMAYLELPSVDLCITI